MLLDPDADGFVSTPLLAADGEAGETGADAFDRFPAIVARMRSAAVIFFSGGAVPIGPLLSSLAETGFELDDPTCCLEELPAEAVLGVEGSM